MSYTEKEAELERKLRELNFDGRSSIQRITRTDRSSRLVGDVAASSTSLATDARHDHGSERTLAQSAGSTLKKSQSGKRERLDWKFVDNQDNNDKILCKICMDVLVEPHLITCCGECACRRCFDHHWQTQSVRGDGKRRCPFCRVEVFRLIRNCDLEREINKLKVLCIHVTRGCLWSGRLQDGESHLNECEFCPIDCPNRCGYDKIEKRNIGRHLVECPMQIVECSFEQVGCSCGRLPRSEVKVHSNKDIHHHLILLAKSSIKLYEECDVTLTDLRSKVVKEKQAVIRSRKQELATLEQTIRSLEGNLFDLQNKLKKLREKDDMNKRRCAAQLKGESEQTIELRSFCTQSLAEAQSLPIPTATGTSCLPVTFTVGQFSSRKRNNEQWMSPPFYTHCGGYKLCLEVYPNGCEEAKGKFVSVFFHMMSGEFDDYLMWPFPGAVINISALSQRNAVVAGLLGSRGNFGADINLFGPDTKAYRSRVYDGSFGPGCGHQNYIPHTLIDEYLAEDSFKVTVFHIQFVPF